MAMGKRKRRERQKGLWIPAADLPSAPGHPYYDWLRQLLDSHGFDAFVEQVCEKFYAPSLGRPGLAPGLYFRMLLIGYVESLDFQRSIAWVVADSITLRRFLGIEWDEPTPSSSTIQRTSQLIDLETHQRVFAWILGILAKDGQRRGQGIGVLPEGFSTDGAQGEILRRNKWKNYQQFLQRLAQASGVETGNTPLPEKGEAGSAMAAAAKELDSLEPKIQNIASQLEICFVTHYQSELRGLRELHKSGALANAVSLHECLQRTLEQARDDRAELQRAHDVRRAAETLFGEASQDVNRSGLMPLVKELDQLYRNLSCPRGKSLLETRDWSGYHELVGSAAEGMKRLKDLTSRRRPEEGRRSGSVPAAPAETDKEKALRILRLPPNPGLEQVQKAYRWLSTLWHPDTGMAGGDEEMKQINWAYGFLKKTPKGS